MRSLFLSIGVFALGCFASCGPKPSNISLAELKSEATPKEVAKVLGQPSQKEKSKFGPQEAERWIYGEGYDRVELVFIGGKLISKTGNFREEGE